MESIKRDIQSEGSHSARPIPPKLLEMMRTPLAEDLLSLMMWHYGRASGRNPRITFGRQDGLTVISHSSSAESKPKHSLTITRSKQNGAILSAEILPYAGTTFDQASFELEEYLKKTLSELSASEKPQVGVSLMFTTAKVSGEFCYSPHFSIREVPQEAPMPPQAWADFPVVISFGYNSPPNDILQRKREDRARNAIVLVLNLLLKDRVYPLRGNYTWGLEINQVVTSGVPVSKFVQIGYMFPNFVPTKYPLTPINLPLIQTIPDDQYYSARGKGINDGFNIPSGLAGHYDAYLHLDSSNKAALLAAARHFQIADQYGHSSSSYAHVALVSAIEVVANTWAAHWAEMEHCEACDQPIYALSKKYRAFLKTYANSSDSARKLYRLHYATRSGVLHAGRFLRSESIGMWDLGLDATEESMRLDFLRNSTRIALINWMHDPFKLPDEAREEI